MLHLHNLNHVQIGLRGLLVDGEDGVDDIGSELGGQGGVELSGERCSRDADEEFSVNLLRELEGIEELRR